MPADVHPRSSDASGHAVEVRGLRINYDETEVVHGIDLAVASGEIVALLGPSGCGKTTTLRAIAGFVVPESGDILLHGQRVTHVPPHKRNVGMVFQGYALFPHLSVFDNVAYGLRMRSISRAEIAERVDHALSLVKLRDFTDRRPKQLSGGQQQRVAIARALVIDPRVLLLDEPLSNLDAKLRQEMRVEMRRLLKISNSASIFVTHDQEEAMVISDRIVLMNDGAVVQQGSPREIYQQPGSLFAAAFIGQANFLRGMATDVSDAGHAVATVEGSAFQGIACGNVTRGMHVQVVVKFERIRSVPQGSEESDNTAECLLDSVSFVGASIQTHCTFRNQHIVSLMLAPTKTASAAPPGSAIRLTWDKAETLIFPDENSGSA